MVYAFNQTSCPNHNLTNQLRSRRPDSTDNFIEPLSHWHLVTLKWMCCVPSSNGNTPKQFVQIVFLHFVFLLCFYCITEILHTGSSLNSPLIQFICQVEAAFPGETVYPWRNTSAPLFIDTLLAFTLVKHWFHFFTSSGTFLVWIPLPLSSPIISSSRYFGANPVGFEYISVFPSDRWGS